MNVLGCNVASQIGEGRVVELEAREHGDVLETRNRLPGG